MVLSFSFFCLFSLFLAVGSCGFGSWFKTNYGTFTCAANCSISGASWGATQQFCTKHGTYENNLCANAWSFPNCHSLAVENHLNRTSIDWTVLNPGSCSCPSGCSHHGVCSLKCHCSSGYQGKDCSLISCSDQSCSNRGKCSSFRDLGIDSCICDDTYALGDCSAEMKPLPEVPSLLPYPQYSDWDLYGNDNPIFNESTIAQIYLTLSQEDLDFLINPGNQDVRDYKHANFSFYNGATSQRLEDVGMRIKGGFSRSYAKKSWKISFNKFEKGRTWAQQKKISLKDVASDPLYLREKASIAAIYAMGAPAPRCSHALVYVNDMLWGLYLILEETGTDEYLKSRFGNDKGSLWKCQGTLEYVSDDPNAYRDQGYKPMNDEAEDFEPLANFIEVLNETPDDEFEEKIQTVMNVEFFLRTFAAEVATGNWDGIWDANNYFLYYNTDGLFYYYRHDLDVALGSLDFFFKFSTRNIWTWASTFPPGPGRLLPDRILAVPDFQEIYASYLSKLLTYVNPDLSGPFAQRLLNMQSSIAPAVSQDQWHSLDHFMYAEPDFDVNLENSITRPAFWPQNPVKQGDSWIPFLGLFEFLKTRNSVTETNLQNGPPNHDEISQK